jgi:hypothetical protein
MAYDARVLQILIASPGDVQDEREIVAEVINDWNYLNSRDRSVVLLPLRWETHAAPELGTRPQASINRQVVDYCDMAIGVFWTRLGTPTGMAESGTAEEIARVAGDNKPVMLYFSRAKVDLQTTDLDEYARLMKFRESLQSKALIESYSSPTEFRETLRRQLDIRIREVIAEDSARQSRSTFDKTQIALDIAAGNPPKVISSSSPLQMTRVICNDRDEIPDYGLSGDTITTGTITTTGTIFSAGNVGFAGYLNQDYYRELVNFYCEALIRRQLWLAVTSDSEHSVRDIHFDVKILSSNDSITMNPPDAPPPTPSQVMQPSPFSSAPPYNKAVVAAPKASVEEISDTEWKAYIDIPIVQAKRRVVSSSFLSLRAAKSGTVNFEATTYSSADLPFSLNAELEISVETRELSYREILKQMIPDFDEGEGSPSTDG